jgi:ornithine cyclodeaminase/alanine dehydrogenase-like protein (mu-crystallin family)
VTNSPVMDGATPALFPHLGAAEIDVATVDSIALIDEIERSFRQDVDPGADPARTILATDGGQMLVMPSALPTTAGVKVIGVAPGNARIGLPRISGIYVLFDGRTLVPIATLDGAALTVIRTAAISAVLIRRLCEAHVERLVVYGTGPQAWSHLSLASKLVQFDEVCVSGRTPQSVSAFLERCVLAGINARQLRERDLAGAGLVLCCTSAGQPLFAADDLAERVLVVAVGSHEPDRRELASDVFSGALAVVETREVACREAGDVIQAINEDALAADDLVELRELVSEAASTARPPRRVFKSVGMAWEDLVVAAHIFERWSALGSDRA